MIVLNEYEWAEEKITSCDLGENTYETLCRIAKYYINNSCTKDYTEQALKKFLIKCDPDISLPKWENAIEKILKYASENKIIEISSIDISVDEMKMIKEFKGVQTQRLAFTLLCLSKYYDTVRENNHHWVNTDSNVIMSLANINTSIKRQSEMYRRLRDEGFLEFSKKVDNTNVRVNGFREGDTAVSITDFRSLGYQYLMVIGEPFFYCTNCGITTKQRSKGAGNRQKYCKECAKKISAMQRIESVVRRREQNKVG